MIKRIYHLALGPYIKQAILYAYANQVIGPDACCSALHLFGVEED